MDFCAYIRKIEEDPAVIAPKLSIRDFLQMRQHLLVCELCKQTIDNILAKVPQNQLTDQFGVN